MSLKKKGVNPNRLMAIIQLFKDRGWYNLSDDILNKRFTNFCVSFGDLSQGEFDLILDLTKRFHLLDTADLIETFYGGYYSIPTEIIVSCNRLLFIPHKEINSKGNYKKEVKSGDFVFNQMSGTYSWCDFSEKFVFCKTAIDIFREFKEGDKICFVDDFIGSGEQCKNTFKSFQLFFENNGKILMPSDVFVISAWAMNQGIKYCEELGLSVYCDQAYCKEISEYYVEPVRSENIKTMKNVENKLFRYLGAYSFGRNQTEALISISGKSPNNTFPIFWKGKNKPFPR